MNFFGHATVAYRQHDQPDFVLGAMLPDLVAMASLRLLSIAHPEVSAGVELHHETDRRFHACEPFRVLCESALRDLEPQGVSRGTARAVGHVGSELLLDGVLCGERAARQAYARALAAGLQPGLIDRLGFKQAPGPDRLRELLQWLADGPLPEGYRDLDFVCDRLARVLARRPRLAMRAADHAPVRRWLGRAARCVAQQADALQSLSSRVP